MFLAACQYDPFAHEYTTRRPDATQLAGTYRPDRETIGRMKSSAGVDVSSSCELVLRPDGTFTARQLPRCWFVHSVRACDPGTRDVSGTWSVGPAGKWWAVHLAAPVEGDSIRSESRESAMLRGEAPPYRIHFILGDPDAGDALAFEKVSR